MEERVMQVLALATIDTNPEGTGNMCRACSPRPPAPPRTPVLRLELLMIAVAARLRSAYTLVYFLAWRLAHRRALATKCRAVPMLTGGPDLHGWRDPVPMGMAFVASEGTVAIAPQLGNAPARRGKSCLSDQELLRRRMQHRWPPTTVKLYMHGGWVITTAGSIARFWGGR